MITWQIENDAVRSRDRPTSFRARSSLRREQRSKIAVPDTAVARFCRMVSKVWVWAFQLVQEEAGCKKSGFPRAPARDEIKRGSGRDENKNVAYACRIGVKVGNGARLHRSLRGRHPPRIIVEQRDTILATLSFSRLNHMERGTRDNSLESCFSFQRGKGFSNSRPTSLLATNGNQRYKVMHRPPHSTNECLYSSSPPRPPALA